MSRQQLKLQTPARAALTFFAEIAVVSSDGSAFAKLLHLIRLVQQSRMLMLWQYQDYKHCHYGTCGPGLLDTVKAGMRNNEARTGFLSPPRTDRGPHRHR